MLWSSVSQNLWESERKRLMLRIFSLVGGVSVPFSQVTEDMQGQMTDDEYMVSRLIGRAFERISDGPTPL